MRLSGLISEAGGKKAAVRAGDDTVWPLAPVVHPKENIERFSLVVCHVIRLTTSKLLLMANKGEEISDGRMDRRKEEESLSKAAEEEIIEPKSGLMCRN